MSASTPEAKIKQKIKRLLDNYRNRNIWYFMPVPYGYGQSTVDYIGIFRGHSFAIEAKRPGKEPTPRQELILEKIALAGGKAFVVNDDVSLAALEVWLTTVGATK